MEPSNFDVISFDLQGTLSDSAFSDEFWLETLPLMYSQQKNVSIEQAKEELKERFSNYGKYDYRYYSLKYWLKELKLNLTLSQIMELMQNKPCFFEDGKEILQLLKRRKCKLIIVSTTTHEFIEAELAENRVFFDAVYSSLDDLNTAGKTKEVFQVVARKLNVSPERIIHIGDCTEMDIENAQKAGVRTFFFDKTLPREEVMGKLRKVLGV